MSGVWLETVYCDPSNDASENKTNSNSWRVHEKMQRLLDMDVTGSGGLSCNSVLFNLENHSEYVLMKRLFEACDKHGTGRVRVSDIMDYLGTIINEPFTEDGDFGKLIQILDPENLNAEVDFDIFKKGLHTWIDEIQTSHSITTNTETQPGGTIGCTGSVIGSSFLESSLGEYLTEERTTVSELLAKLADAQYQSQRLLDANRDTKALLDLKEEEIISTCRELSDAKCEIKRLQEISYIYHEAQAENSELRQQILSIDGELHNERQALQQAKLDKSSLEHRIESHEAQLARLNSELSVSSMHQEILKSSLAEYREKWLNLSELCSTLELQILEKNERIQNLAESFEDMSKYCEDLKYQKQELLEKLTDLQLELSSSKLSPDSDFSGELHHTVTKLTQPDDSGQIEADVTYQCATSICNELKLLFNNTANLPWPLSEKELNENVITAPDLISYSTKCVEDKGKKSKDDRHGDTSQEKEIQYDIPNEKLRFLYTVIKKFKEENTRLRFFAQSLTQFQHKNWVVNQTTCQSDIDSSACVKIDGCAIESSSNYLSQYNTMLKSQVKKLKRCNNELAEKLHITELKLNELDETTHNTYAFLEKERQKCADLEENLCSTTLARQLDLKDIWRLVQKDVEAECQERQEDSFNSFDSEDIKDKIIRDIEVLRSDLYNREVALGALRRNHVDADNYRDVLYSLNWFSRTQNLSPGSPLVDALTIDVLNGNLPMYSVKYPQSSILVSCEDVDCYECTTARLVSQKRYTSSCPSIMPHKELLSNKYNYPSSVNVDYGEGERDENLDPKVTKETVSTSQCSSTHKRQRSLYGSNRRQDFIKHSSKHAIINSTQSITSNQQVESCENDLNANNTILRSDFDLILSTSSEQLADLFKTGSGNTETLPSARRPSFRNAVEGLDHTHTESQEVCLTKSNSEELRRASFCSAIELGKEEDQQAPHHRNRKVVQITSPDSLKVREEDQQAPHHRNRKVVQITSPDSLKVREEDQQAPHHRNRKVVQITSPDSLKVRTKTMKDYNPPGYESTKTVTFQLDENEVDAVSGAKCTPVKDASYYCRLPKAVSTMQSSMFTSPYVSSQHDNSLLRKDSAQNYKFQIFLEDVQSYTVPKSMEDWDMTPQNMGYDPDLEQIENLSDPDQELPDVTEYINNAYDMQRSGNLPLQHRETISVIGTKEDLSRHDTGVKVHQVTSIANPHNAGTAPFNARSVQAFVPCSTDTAASSLLSLTSTLASASPGTVTEVSSSSPVSCESQRGALDKRWEVERGHCSKQNVTTKRVGCTKPVPVIDSSTTSEVEIKTDKIVVPPSPPSPRISGSSAQRPQPLGPTRLSELRQTHLTNKKRDQNKFKNMKLPELSENTELDTSTAVADYGVALSARDPCILSAVYSTGKENDLPQISVTGQDYLEPPPATDEIVTPSLPSSFLKKLGLSVNGNSSGSEKRENNDPDVSVDELPEKELESKFISLSLALKTDKFTLEQRVSVQERSRDLAEANVDTEIRTLRDLLESLHEMVSETQVRAIVQKLRQHIDVLEQSAARVSSRAEVYGAVQQERRMCKAMEVMILYTENLRRIREREESELAEARKVLSERSVNGFSMDTDSCSGRRSTSISGASPIARPMRRRSEIALPKVLGGSGSPSMIQTASLESLSPFMERSYPGYNFLKVSAETEDPKSRFQSAVASMSMQHAVTSTVRQASLEKQRSVSFTPSTSPSSAVGSAYSSGVSTPLTSYRKEDQSICVLPESGRKISQDEDAFRKGYEEGLKVKLSKELNELREQQNSISQDLEHMIDRVDQSEQEEEEFLSRSTRLETLMKYISRIMQQVIQHDWRSNKKLIRNFAGFILLFLAIFVVFLSPPISTVDVSQITTPPA